MDEHILDGVVRPVGTQPVDEHCVYGARELAVQGAECLPVPLLRARHEPLDVRAQNRVSSFSSSMKATRSPPVVRSTGATTTFRLARVEGVISGSPSNISDGTK